MSMLLQTEALRYSYQKDHQLVFPDFGCQVNDQLLILGPSGSGKSTLLHLLALILPIQEGKIFINQTDISQLEGNKAAYFRAQHIGLIFQQHHFVKSLSVMENLEMTGYFGGGFDKSKARYLLESLGIAKYENKPIFELSGGEKQRLGIARALLLKPKVILADEPTASLDDQNADYVYQLLAEKAKENNAALLIVTHDNRLKTKVKNQIIL